MDDFIINETTKTLEEYTLNIPNAHLEYMLIPHFFRGKPIDFIGPYCFGNVQIENLVIGEGVKKLETRAFENSYCYNIELPKGIEIDTLCFMGSRLREITLPDDLTDIKPSTFARCKNLTAIHGGASVKTIESQAFANCEKISKIHFNNLESVGKAAFIGCKNLQNITLGNNIKHLDEYIFHSCSNLKNVSLIGSFDRLKANTFFGANGIKQLTLSSSADSLYIPPHCFDDTSLEEITFLGDFEPIVKERSCFPKNILIRATSGSPAMELGYYFPLKPL